METDVSDVATPEKEQPKGEGDASVQYTDRTEVRTFNFITCPYQTSALVRAM